MIGRSTIAAVIVTLAVAPFGGGTGTASAASVATAAPPGCYSTYVCYWSGSDYTGTLWNTNPVPSGQCRSLTHAYSAYNNSRSSARFWEYSRRTPSGVTVCEGRNKLLAPGQSTGNLGFDAHGLGGS
jgi:hypothetical protein